jgi:hypothetical protein
MRRLALFLAGGMVVAHCHREELPGASHGPGAAPEFAGPASGDGAHPDECTRACAQLGVLQCPEAEPTPGGITCAELCVRMETSGAGDVRTGCIVRAKSAADVRACGVRCVQ